MRTPLPAFVLLVCCALLKSASATHAADMPWPPFAATSHKQLPVRAISGDDFANDVCAVIDERATWHGLPPQFIARLIATESRFDPQALSPAGAEGIAQFMPGTARLRGLDDPYDPAKALAASIDYLAELHARYGSLGLAAIAYNAGEGRVMPFLAGGGLPYETENYVVKITGREASEWVDITLKHDIPVIAEKAPFTAACPDFVDRPKALIAKSSPTAPRKPWGVLISEHFSRQVALKTYNRHRRRHPDLFKNRNPMVIPRRNRSLGHRLRYSAQIGFDDRKDALKTCLALQFRGVPCLVVKAIK